MLPGLKELSYIEVKEIISPNNGVQMNPWGYDRGV